MVDGINSPGAPLALVSESLIREVEAVLARGYRWLHFPAPLEARFLDDTHVHRRRHYIAMVVLAITVFDIFLIGDYQLIPDIFALSVILRIGFLTPMAAIVVMLLRSWPNRRMHEVLVAFSCVATGESLLLLMLKTGSPTATHYYMGVLLPLIFMNTVQRIRFWYAVGGSLLTLVFVALSMTQMTQLTHDVRQTFVLITVATCLFTLVALYRLEYEERSNYLYGLKMDWQRRTVEAQRVEAELQKASIEQAQRNIALLSEIGRQITATLDQEAVMETLYRHVHELMDASVFGIALYRADAEAFECPFMVVNGHRLSAATRPLVAADPLMNWCLSHRREILIDDLQVECAHYRGDSGGDDASSPCAITDTHSALYEPLLVNNRAIGVITAQSFVRASYRPVHLSMLRTLASYAAVALDNAHAYRQLGEAQRQLVHQDTMASLGRLVAGVAHEVNTPLGNIRMSTSLIRDRLDSFESSLKGGSLQRRDVENWLGDMQQAAEVLDLASQRAAQQISGFKQLAVDQSSGLSCSFDVGATIDVVLKSMAHYLRTAGVTATVTIEPGLLLTGEPGRFEQAIVNFITNAVVHGYEGRGPGQITIAAHRLDGHMAMSFSDQGCGMSPAVRAKIFEPFFTTRFGQGGSGLGLYIAHNIIVHGFGGQLDVESEPGCGTTFRLQLPLARSS
jgi:signal transduction histidine kinase